MSRLLVWSARLAFIGVVLSVSVLALLPSAPSPATFIPTDKVQHFIAYSVMMATALAAFPSASVALLGLLVFGQSALIEVVQPMTGRDLSLWDLVANGLGILAVAMVVILNSLRHAGRSQAIERPSE